MLSQFKTIQPQLSVPAYGPEPTLFNIVKQYYTSHGIEPGKAEKLTNDYLQAWSDLYISPV